MNLEYIKLDTRIKIFHEKTHKNKVNILKKTKATLQKLKNKILRKKDISITINRSSSSGKFSKSTIDIDEKTVLKKLREKLPEVISDEALEYITSVWKEKLNAKIEYGQIFDYKTGEKLGEESEGTIDEVNISSDGVDLTRKNLASQHNHINGKLCPPSPDDFFITMSNDWKDFEFVLSEKEIWVIEAEGHFNTLIREIIKENMENFVNIAILKAKAKGLKNDTNERIKYINDSYSADVEKYIDMKNEISVYRVIL
ncbi:hypothetical protein [uncultured Methanobrevibacter sp.]|uniref:hypothetical protein n=1 Tax=uncultured Methanobrevibacter sp. TaxID=253161 RepID=UPI0026DFE1FA|nr:hypothetical protein [uncultured Methanobrevibacter sp.]